MTENLLTEITREVERRIIEENIPRIKKCISHLTTEDIWYRPNENVVSVGNLILHLCGNIRQWLISGMGAAPDIRNRQGEFDEKGPIPTAHLIEELDRLSSEIISTLAGIKGDDLLRKYRIQGVFEESGIGILFHITEHFSYHTGQITWFVKTRKNIDLKYYGGLDLNSPNVG